MVSHYWWQGELERGEEVVMIIKTRASLAEAVRTAVKEMHSYTMPAILVIPLESVDQGYLSLDDGGDGSGEGVMRMSFPRAREPIRGVGEAS